MLVRPVDAAAPQALPKGARPVSSWRDQDKAWLDVAQGVRRAIGVLRERRREATAALDILNEADTKLQGTKKSTQKSHTGS